MSGLWRTCLGDMRRGAAKKSTAARLENELDQAREILVNKVGSFATQLPEPMSAEWLDKGQAYKVLRRLVNYAPFKAESVDLKDDRFLDFQVCDSALECHRDHLRLDDDFVAVLTLKGLPANTCAFHLRDLRQVPGNFIAVSEWRRESNISARRVIQSKRRHFYNLKASLLNYLSSGSGNRPTDMLIDDSAAALVQELGGCLEEIEIKGRALGSFSLTVILYDRERAKLQRTVADCFRVFARQGIQMTEERYNLLNAWLAALPANGEYNLRRHWFLDDNAADLSFLFSSGTGDARDHHLDDEYLAVLESDHHTPYFLTLHHADIGHTLVLGATGSGKSFLLNFLITHAQKYGPVTFLFDLGGGYESVARLFGGAYLAAGTFNSTVRINPFVLAPTHENRNFLVHFLKVLIGPTAELTESDERDLYEQIENLYLIEPGQRRLSTLTHLLNRKLRGVLQKWIEGGQYGSWFDHADDTLTLASFQAFDFEGMEKTPEVLEALLFYVLHRASAVFSDPQSVATLKLFVIDEAWRFFRHPAIRSYIAEALKTWRKKNGAMILATQSGDDLLRSEILNAIVESCATKLFLANPEIDRNLYREIFHLSETEAEAIARLVPKKQILVKRPDIAKVVNLNVDPKDYWMYTSSPKDRQRRQETIERYGFEQGLDILTRSTP